MSEQNVRIRLLFADEGAFHHEELHVPRASVDGYDRLIDALREDPALLKLLYVDLDRLSAAWVVSDAT